VSARPLVDVRIEGLATRGGVAPGVRDVSIHVRYGEFFTLLGPPKSGKSDVLRAVAGFLPTTAGRVLVDGQDISTLPAGRRDIGYVFQDGALWPHMSVGEHIAFGLELQLAAQGDPIDDPTADWPPEREVVRLGRLEITALASDRERDGDILVFDPTRVPDGIRLTDDKILLARPGAYSVSVTRRTSA